MNIPFMKKKVITDHMVNKQFNYKQGDINLSFRLRVDVKTELKAFEQLLTQALKEVQEEIKS